MGKSNLLNEAENIFDYVSDTVFGVSRDNVGKGCRALGGEQVVNPESLIEPTLKRHEFI